ncbi:beta strand repeat-containing protein [Aquimarina brevivitae]|uniref:CUB-like protein n=1 Tax=Aquimarina brevivitae TaxID=323412 RepID=A0A4Q7NX64_9FLAO|nr:Calx-beta domain-containing protein [Aquimarina brevivitae]RZS91953.1 CUB-like protein [Aquimarina brevivitae]
MIKNTKHILGTMLLIALCAMSGYSQDTFRDNFNTVSYSNNNGTQTFSSNWVEINETTNPNGGNIRIDQNWLRFRGLNDRSISRGLNLSAYNYVVLTLDYARTNGDEILDIQLWNNNTSSYETIASTGAGTGSISYILSPEYISTNSSIQIVTGSGTWNNPETVYLDNITFSATTDYVINDGVTATTCGGAFLDTGFESGNYQNNESITYTICPDTPGTYIDLNFTSFDVETFYDGLSIYQGNDTSTLIDRYDNGNIPGRIISSDPSGCLTFQFASDGSVTGSGWEAAISCNNSIITINDISVNESDGSANLTVTYNGVSTTPFSVDFTTADNTAFAAADYTTTNGTLNFTGTPSETRTITIPIINDTFLESDETFFVNLSNLSGSSTTIADNQGIVTINDDPGDTPIPVNEPLTLFEQFNGYIDYTTAGGTLRTSSTNPCAITTTSSASLTAAIPNTATIEKAYLLWSHSGANPDNAVTFEGQSVVANWINEATVTVGGGLTFFGMGSDVTDIINAISDPTSNVFDFSDLNIDNTNNINDYCTTSTVLGGWSLMIFYSDPSLPAASIRMYQGFDPQAGTASSGVTTSYTLDGFFAIGAAGAKTSVLSWEGDEGLNNSESLTVTTGSGTFSLAGDGNNDGSSTINPFNSTIFNNTATPTINNSNVYGLDFDTYDVAPFISTGDNSLTTNVGVGQDLVILNSVLLKVPGNLITGTVFEDINYPGGSGRDLSTSAGIPIAGVTVELYDNTNTLIETTTTDTAGQYLFGGMPNGDYNVRVVNGTVTSTRGGGASCSNCIGVQTFRAAYVGGSVTAITDEVGGATPSAADVGTGTFTGAQSVSPITITNDGAVGIDFGFNFNTIVNTNASGQGSLEQFIVNANNLDQTGLDIEANSIFDPAAGEDVSIFMIPTSSDPLGRTTDPNYNASGYLAINQPNGDELSVITADGTHIDGRTQTAYSGDTNSGTIGQGGSSVGVGGTTLPSYNLPEIQLFGERGDVLQLEGSNTVIRGIALYAANRTGIQQNDGTNNLIIENLIGVDATGNVGAVPSTTYIDQGIEVTDGSITIDSNYIASNSDYGVIVDGGTSTTIQNNHFINNGYRACEYNVYLSNGSGIVIQQNLIENSEATGIFDEVGYVTIDENSITGSGANTNGGCSALSGIRLTENNTAITNNIIYANAGAGIVLEGNNKSGNLLSQNSIYGNGTTTAALGIDLANDGVTLNDTGDGDNGPNGRLNFPVFEAVTVSGNTLKLTGWSRPGATIEIFLTDISQGTATVGDNQLGLTQDYGEGQIFLGTVVEGSTDDTDNTVSNYNDADGNTDNTNRFNFSITIPPSTLSVGDTVTATATIANSTSEFANTHAIGAATVITNRKITYRVRPEN